MRKRTIAALLISAMTAAVLSGCSGSDSGTANPGESKTAETAAAETDRHTDIGDKYRTIWRIRFLPNYPALSGNRKIRSLLEVRWLFGKKNQEYLKK